MHLFRRFLFLSLLFTTTISFAMPTQQDICEENGINYKMAKDFYVNLQTLLREDEVEKIAKYISFPLRVNERKANKNSTHYVRNLRTFNDEYPKLFNEPMKKILMTSDVFCNYQGAAIGNGNIWFRTPKEGVKIFVINTVDLSKQKK